MDAVTSVVIGPAQHGVVRHAVRLARAAGVAVRRQPVVDGGGAWPPPSALHHWHFTDRLFGTCVEEATGRLLGAMEAVGGRHVVSLHDVPPVTTDARDVRRGAAYRSLTEAADAVVVASEHERVRLAGAGASRSVDVIALPIVRPARRAVVGPVERSVVVLGFVYPGKGHADVLDAAAELPGDVGIVVVGRASDGHDDLLEDLRRTAARQHRPFHTTGYLADAAVAARLRQAGVPVVPARDTSASASLATWIGAGRRPLVARNDYTAELAARGGDLVTTYEPGELAAALRRALAEPATTWRVGPVPADLGLPAVARAHLALYRRVLSA